MPTSQSKSSQRVLRTLAVFALFAATSPLAAQVFPGISAKSSEQAVREAEARGGAAAQPPKQPDSVTDGNKVEGADKPAVDLSDYKKGFQAAIDGVKGERTRAERVVNAVLRTVKPEIKDMVRARLQRLLENFSDAAKDFRKVRPVAVTPDNASPAVASIMAEARGGQAILDAWQCDIQKKFNLSAKSQDALDKDFEKTRKDAENGAKELENLAGTAPYVGADMRTRADRLRTWIDVAQGEWRALYVAWLNAQANPHDFAAVQGFATQAMKESHMPMWIHARQCLKYLIDKFPSHPEVLSGKVATALAWNYWRTYDFEEMYKPLDAALKYCGDDPAAVKTLNDQRANLQSNKDRFDQNMSDKK